MLSDLRDRFGNVGLAAAAYNAGPGAVTNWRAGNSELPFETQDYVVFITGRPAADWEESDGRPRHPGHRTSGRIFKLVLPEAGPAPA